MEKVRLSLHQILQLLVIGMINLIFRKSEIQNYCKFFYFYVSLEHLQSVKFSYEFNDLVYFVRHLTHIATEHGLQREILTDSNFRSLIEHIKKCLRLGKHDAYPYIGSYAYCLSELGVKDQELWLLME
jgi:hypothetical protein